MFTSEPSLAQRIERMIGDVAIVDTRSHLDVRALGATDLAALMAEPPLRIVLEGVGMPAGMLDATRSVEERVVAALPYLRQVRTTAAGWCLFRIFRDLYDFDEPHLTLANVGGLMDRVARAAVDPGWASSVIRERARVGLVITPAPADPVAAPDLDFVAHRLEVTPAGSGTEPAELIRTQVFEQLDQQINGKVRFVSCAGPLQVDNPVHAAVLRWHHLHQWPIQILLDSPDAGPVVEAIETYPGARFGLMASVAARAETGFNVASLAGHHPNVFAEGFAGSGARPSRWAAHLLDRIEQAGMTKVGGFGSGAATAEWLYGTLQATRKATAAALAQAVANGFFEEDEVPPLLQSIFASAPTAWYRLAEGRAGRV